MNMTWKKDIYNTLVSKEHQVIRVRIGNQIPNRHIGMETFSNDFFLWSRVKLR